MTGIVLRFKLERETPGALRYQEVDDKGAVFGIADGALVGTLYCRKSQLPARWTELEVIINGAL